MWTLDLATGDLRHDGALVGTGTATIAAGEYQLGPMTDALRGVPILPDAGHLVAGDDAAAAIAMPPDVVQRVIASRDATLAVLAPAAPPAQAERVDAPGDAAA